MLILNAFLMTTGHHEASWRYPKTQPERAHDIRHYQELAQLAERAKLDAVFLADGPALRQDIRHRVHSAFEPITLLTAVAVATERIGLISTASTSYYEPYNLARLFSSLDHISGGRAGWNIVTTAGLAAAQNFGLDAIPAHQSRYQRAREFVDVVLKLWDSWEDDAIVNDTAAGIYADDSRIHEVGHVGPEFQVKGPLNAPRSPQGHPVLVQAGSSEDGRGFAATYAEAIFTAHQTLASAQEFYADIKQRVATLGRDPAHVKVLPGLSPFIGSTEEGARALEREFNELTVPAYGLRQLKGLTGVDLSAHPLDGPVPADAFGDVESVEGAQSRFVLVLDIIDREKPTIRQLLHRLAGGRGHWVFAGTPEQVADHIERWFTQGAADGFNIMPPYLPGGLADFTEQVVPLLQRRGLFRTEYAGTTLRDHYGLPRPSSRYAESPARTA
ncbi:LLM class flavin-dependent oxidoreductase [Actinopolymorpha alba]|uniref:LLM class flavin-dependent oxidoreductase n=1 Tax=Actinopolymorpha alba TaxID=533267 RepID=UPI00036DE1FC|nr:LLM class flavin-dependent oxidoreductase [Actinopolymorpha alba]